ncbi:MAG: MFS transporter [Candidatus Thorarchaeota archaeon]|nr:MFS transporter [Candidatus Thorarchaeota archaeon]
MNEGMDYHSSSITKGHRLTHTFEASIDSNITMVAVDWLVPETMESKKASAIGIYVAFSIQAIAMAIGWQFISYFLKHELGVTSYLVMTTLFAIPALITIGAVGFWGFVSDKLGRRKPVMILGFVGYFATYLFYSFVTNEIEYFIIAVIGTFFSAGAIPAGQALLTTDTHTKGERLSLLLVAQSAGWFLGALSSGFLYDLIGMYTLYRIAALLSIFAAVSCIIIVHDVPIREHVEHDTLGFIHLLGRPGMPQLLLAIALSSLGVNAITSVVPIIIPDELGGQISYVGLGNSAATALAVLITAYVGRIIDRKGPVGVIIIGYATYAMFAFGFALVTDPISATILYALPLYPLASTASFTFGSLISGEKERGRAMGLVSGAQNAGAALGPIIGGVFADQIFHRAQPIAWITLMFNIVALVLSISLIGVGRRLQAETVAKRVASESVGPDGDGTL